MMTLGKMYARSQSFSSAGLSAISCHRLERERVNSGLTALGGHLWVGI